MSYTSTEFEELRVGGLVVSGEAGIRYDDETSWEVISCDGLVAYDADGEELSLCGVSLTELETALRASEFHTAVIRDRIGDEMDEAYAYAHNTFRVPSRRTA